jgi:hypothetical protein
MMQCMSIVHHLSLVPGALDHGQTYRVTFEPVEVPNPVLGLAARFLQRGHSPRSFARSSSGFILANS